MKILEYAFNTVPNEMISAGQTVPTSTIENEKVNKISIYPNPATSIQHIQFENPMLKQISIELYSITGEKIKTFEYSSKQHTIAIQNNVSSLPSGLYYYKIACGSRIESILFNKE